MNHPRRSAADLLLMLPLPVGLIVYVGLLGLPQWADARVLALVPATMLTAPVALLAVVARTLAQQRPVPVRTKD